MTSMDLNIAPLLPALTEPRHISSPAPWSGHTPFAMWLISVIKPRLLVELGAYSGISYLAFCQAVEAAGIGTRCYAVDTWQGDEHAGYYGERIYQTLRQHHDPCYASFSTLMRQTFDEAVLHFSDASIDLLHIDGLHTYEAVRHDFETWMPKLTDRGVVLLHDTEVRQGDFGVWRFWEEISQKYPSISFQHSHGLGVLFVGSRSCEPLAQQGFDPGNAVAIQNLRRLFRVVGAAQERRAELCAVRHDLGEIQQELARQKEQDDELQVALQERENLLQVALQERENLLQAEARSKAQLQQTLESHQRWLKNKDQLIAAREHALAQRDGRITELEAALAQTLGRRMRRRGRAVLQQLRPTTVTRRIVKVIHRSRNAMRYLVRGDFAALRNRAAGLLRERQFAKMVEAGAGSGNVGILTTQHTLYVAHAISQALGRAGLRCQILLEDQSSAFPHDFYIVLCAQMFTHLPPGEKRIVFQMEQTVSDRWFDTRYLQILENSRAVFDYSLANLAYLAGRKIAYPHVFHVPLGAVTNYRESQQIQPVRAEPGEASVLFYGDPHAPRRQQYLAALQARHKVRIISDLFGAELQTAIASAQVVVNIHYYEGALLESTRIFECLSLGARVVSETAADVADYPGLEGAVHLVPVGDIEAMVHAVDRALAEEGQPLDANQAYLQQTQDRFQFMLYRALLAQRLVSYAQFETLSVPPRGHAYALSLPETIARRAAYMAMPTPGVEVFDGLRARPGWIGCALSYKYMCANAWQQGVEQLLICEDDVELPPNYDEVMQTVRGHLQATHGQWDIFVGIIAHLHQDATVLDVQERDGLTFVTLDKMTSMVFNIYNRAAMEVIARWDETLEDDQTNTIDRYLERASNLRTVTLLEPVFGHREDLNSSLWGFGNEQYNSYIEKSRAQLRHKVEAFRQSNGN